MSTAPGGLESHGRDKSGGAGGSGDKAKSDDDAPVEAGASVGTADDGRMPLWPALRLLSLGLCWCMPADALLAADDCLVHAC